MSCQVSLEEQIVLVTKKKRWGVRTFFFILERFSFGNQKLLIIPDNIIIVCLMIIIKFEIFLKPDIYAISAILYYTLLYSCSNRVSVKHIAFALKLNRFKKAMNSLIFRQMSLIFCGCSLKGQGILWRVMNWRNHCEALIMMVSTVLLI